MFRNVSNYLNNNPIRVLIIWFFLLTIFKSIISLFFEAPQSLGDEMEYDLIARMIANGAIILGTGHYPSGYPPGYSACISLPYFFFSDRMVIYHVELFINAILSSLAIFPAFFILKRFSTDQTAVMGSLTISVLPVTLAPSFLLMSENLFTLLFLLASCGLIYSLSEKKSSLFDIGTGFLIIGSILVRPSGIALIMGLVLTLIYYISKTSENRRDSLTKAAYLVSPIIAIIALWGVERILGDGSSGIHEAIYLSPGVLPLIGEHLTTFIHTAILGGLYLAYSTYLFLFFATGWYLWKIFKNDKNSNDKYLDTNIISKKTTLIFVFISSLFLYVIAILFTFGFIQWDIPHIYGRYIDPIIPFIILFSFVGTEQLITSKKEEQKYFFIRFFVFLFITTAIAAFTFLPSLPVQNNNAGIYYLYSFSDTFTGIILVLPLLFSIGYYFLILNQVSVGKIFSLILILCVLTSIPILAWQIQMGKNYGEVHKAFCGIQSTLGAEATYIWDQSGNNGRYDPVYHDSIKFWIGDRLVEQNCDEVNSSIRRSYGIIPTQTKGVYLISRQDYPLKKLARMEDFRFYRIS